MVGLKTFGLILYIQIVDGKLHEDQLLHYEPTKAFFNIDGPHKVIKKICVDVEMCAFSVIGRACLNKSKKIILITTVYSNTQFITS